MPVLLLQGERVLKTIRFRDGRYIGDPINSVRIFNDKCVDELIVYDIGAWRLKSINWALLSRIAAEARMPLCYGGGVSTVEQAVKVINLGFEKVSISSGALQNSPIIKSLSDAVGSQSVVLTFDVLKNPKTGCWDIYTENGTKPLNRHLNPELIESYSSCVGEYVFNVIDRDGTGAGYDLALASYVSKFIKVPFTIVGGAGSLDHIRDLIKVDPQIGVGVGSFFLFKGPNRAVLLSYSRP